MMPATSTPPTKPRREAICCLLTVWLTFLPLDVARADMIATEQVVNSTQPTSRDSVLTLLRRSDVEYQLQFFGVDQKSAEKRVAAMTDEEVQALAGRLDSLHAGGQYGGVVGVGGVGVAGSYGYSIGGPVVIAALVAILTRPWVNAGSQTETMNSDYMTSNPPPMDPDRKIAEQDCTKPIDMERGNLLCK